ncbi:DUF6274 family protein [Streptomyces sp. NPDC059909]|uniref:DUF6274 family protein n=1 Tax=Streptomyces sp. NPDC059909 TaxID=3346998 RepID=UPI0036566D31
MAASTARHETRALLRAHLAAVSGYRHLTQHCPVCHRLLRLAMNTVDTVDAMDAVDPMDSLEPTEREERDEREETTAEDAPSTRPPGM